MLYPDIVVGESALKPHTLFNETSMVADRVESIPLFLGQGSRFPPTP